MNNSGQNKTLSDTLRCRVHYKQTNRRFSFRVSNTNNFESFLILIRDLFDIKNDIYLSYHDWEGLKITFSSQVEFKELYWIYRYDEYSNLSYECTRNKKDSMDDGFIRIDVEDRKYPLHGELVSPE